MSGPPITKTSQAKRRAISEQRMVDAAVELITELGISGTTLRAVGERAGYSRGLVTYQYGSKVGLMRAVTKTLAGFWLERLLSAVGQRSAVDGLCAAIDAHYHFIHEMPSQFRALSILAFASIDPGSGIQSRVSEVQAKQRQSVCGWVRDGQAAGVVRPDISPERFAEHFLATISGIGLQWMVNPDVELLPMHNEFKRSTRNMLAPNDGKSSLQ
ncbi:MAG: TetR/AcrR family transcriptional regulator [Gammaproteobacteria bacterium]|nr:TetR/AcrR family transcriptional regulator [Gammaproteobacteria bacterium]